MRAAVFMVVGLFYLSAYSAPSTRIEIPLMTGWKTALGDIESARNVDYGDGSWKTVTIPHNWEDYQGVRYKEHNNLHGICWYRKHFSIGSEHSDRRVFVEFQGVGSYADVYLNGNFVGHHDGGRTCFSVDLTQYIKFGEDNVLSVRADHHSGINDLPWICGGCVGVPKSEGSQPMGIFRPVKILLTNRIRVVPFGVFVWTPQVSAAQATVRIQTEIQNYGAANQLRVISEIVNENDEVVASEEAAHFIGENALDTVNQTLTVGNPHLWDGTADPYMHRVRTTIYSTAYQEADVMQDVVESPFGIRSISWPKRSGLKYFTINNKQVFINGMNEYEHLLGCDHAFTDEQIDAQISMIKQAGCNGLRDAHHPHNLRYYELCDKLGIVVWTQMTTALYYDNEKFKNNFCKLTAEWVRERRNHPCIVLWGISNESHLPDSLAKVVHGIIRQYDTTTVTERLTTTCNGGTGADENFPQKWEGCYGGNYNEYKPSGGTLVGEYGMWNRIGNHADTVYAGNEAKINETYVSDLLETKIRLGVENANNFCGHFQWLLASHSNPGRALNMHIEFDPDTNFMIGPVNPKGSLTSWREPYDSYYMRCSHYLDKDKQPMVHIASHTWPNRWSAPGKYSNIVVYSNCDQVELFNDYKSSSLGVKSKGSFGTHFQWDNVDINYNVLYAEGRVGGAVVATDAIVLNNLPIAPHRNGLDIDDANLTAPAANVDYLYRVNCGGKDYLDKNQQQWSADKPFATNSWGYVSWGADLGYTKDNTIGRTWDPIAGTNDDTLFQTFRWGRNKNSYHFTVPSGMYTVELYFVEPWYGTGGGLDCTGWRMFDVAVEDSVRLNDFDIWKEVGHGRACKKIFHNVGVYDGTLDITFPEVKVNQATISAIAIGQQDGTGSLGRNFIQGVPRLSVRSCGRSSIAVDASFTGRGSLELISLNGRVVETVRGDGTIHHVFGGRRATSAQMYIMRLQAAKSMIVRKVIIGY